MFLRYYLEILMLLLVTAVFQYHVLHFTDALHASHDVYRKYDTARRDKATQKDLADDME